MKVRIKFANSVTDRGTQTGRGKLVSQPAVMEYYLDDIFAAKQ